MTPDERAKLRALAGRATAGPWASYGMTAASGSSGPPWGRVDGPKYVSLDRGEAFAPEDAALIAAARNALVPLLDEIDGLTTCALRLAAALVPDERVVRQEPAWRAHLIAAILRACGSGP
jgi:hypothetical protein